MNYSEARKIVDEIIDGKKKVKVDGSLGVLISYLSKEKEEHNGKYDNRVKRYEKIEKMNMPSIILTNEARMMGSSEGAIYAYDDAIKVAMCIKSLEGLCPTQLFGTIFDSKNRGCRDCMHRFCNYEGGSNVDSHFYCGIHAEMEEEEKKILRQGMSEYNEDGSIREYTPEEIEAEIAKGRSVFGNGGRFNEPCKHYKPSPAPLWQVSDKEIEAAMKSLNEEIPDLEDEGWDEESILMHMVFCKRNKSMLNSAQKRLLKAIFGEDEEEKSNEDNA